MARDWRKDPAPFESFALSNNSAEIRRVKTRIEELEKRADNPIQGWKFDVGEVVANTENNHEHQGRPKNRPFICTCKPPS